MGELSSDWAEYVLIRAAAGTAALSDDTAKKLDLQGYDTEDLGNNTFSEGSSYGSGSIGDYVNNSTVAINIPDLSPPTPGGSVNEGDNPPEDVA